MQLMNETFLSLSVCPLNLCRGGIMSTCDNPYVNLPETAFWRSSIALKHFSEINGIAEKIPLIRKDKIATAGSCFAQHIGNALIARGADFLDLEPAPLYLTSDESKKHGFNIYSCRYGNIYTARQLRQLVQEAFGDFKPGEQYLIKDGRFFDSMRPSVDPVGHESIEIILALRKRHLAKVREMLQQVDVFIFTLGLTEAWELISDGTVFPMCPGTIAGEFDKTKYRFHNFTYQEIIDDLLIFRNYLKKINNKARILLTVSPVPLTATATGQHVLSATSYSKSTLRAVAGDMASKFDDVYYFPSYEIITSHPMRGIFFNNDMRTVNKYGVEFVMNHFFNCVDFDTDGSNRKNEPTNNESLICDEEKLEIHSLGV